jgi:hypothetical protein
MLQKVTHTAHYARFAKTCFGRFRPGWEIQLKTFQKRTTDWKPVGMSSSFVAFPIIG